MPTPSKRSRSKSRTPSKKLSPTRHSLYALEHAIAERQDGVSKNQEGGVKKAKVRSRSQGRPKKKGAKRTAPPSVGLYLDRAVKGFVGGMVFTVLLIAMVGYLGGDHVGGGVMGVGIKATVGDIKATVGDIGAVEVKGVKVKGGGPLKKVGRWFREKRPFRKRREGL